MGSQSNSVEESDKDTWGKTCNSFDIKADGKFEDNFIPALLAKLEDSEEYLAVLEKKLKEVRDKNNIIENLSAYREDCIRRLLQSDSNIVPDQEQAENLRLLQD